MIVSEHLGKRYKGEQSVDAVEDLALKVERGRFLAIVGRSGSGKSSLLGMLGGIARPTSGQIAIDGVNQWALSSDAHADFRNKKLGFVFQFASLLPTLRAVDNVALPALIAGTEERLAYSRAHALLERVGLADRYDFFPQQLSGGEQRRVAIARALINAPEILLADEPTADLDEETESEILDLLIDIHQSFNLTLVVVTHNEDIAKRADQVLHMRKGKAVEIQQQTDKARTTKSDAAERLQRIFDRSQDEIAAEKVRLGEGFERLIGKFILWLVPACLAFWGINATISYYQENALNAAVDHKHAMEDLAMSMRADVKDIAFGQGRTYNVTLYLRNTNSDQKLYVMSPAVRAFVQLGMTWQEIPTKPLVVPESRVQQISGTQTYTYSIEPDVSGFTELIPHYMHVRITNDLLVSPSDQPKEDLVERSDSYYVYLKPHDADDNAILQKMKFPGKPPVWIPMPPH